MENNGDKIPEKAEIVSQAIKPDEVAAEAFSEPKKAAEDSSPNGKKKKFELKRGTMVAIGSSITAVLLTIIIIIVVVAVQSAGKMTQVFATNFSGVFSDVRNDKFVASISGDYYLMEGDKRVSGPYVNLKYNETFDGYLFVESDGDSGLINIDGDTVYKSATDDPYKITAARFIFKDAATFLVDGVYKTVTLKDKQEVAGLSGIAPTFEAYDKTYFVWSGGKYCLVKVFNDTNGITTKLTYNGTDYTFTHSYYSSVTGLSGSPFVVDIGGKYVCFYDGGVTEGARYKTVSAEYGKQTATLTFIDDKVFIGDKLTSAVGAAGISYDGYVQIGAHVYKVKDAATLELAKEDTQLLRFGSEKEYYFGTATALFAKGGEQITTFSGAWQYLGDKVVLDGTSARTFDAKKKVENVKNVFSSTPQSIFLTTAGELYTIDRVIYTEAAAAALGEPVTVFNTDSGFVVTAAGGCYVTPGEIILKGDYYLLGDSKSYGAVVMRFSDRLDVYKFKATKTELSATYYYANTVIDRTVSRKNGLVFKDAMGCAGAINAAGKLVIKPQYDNISMHENYMIVGMGGIGKTIYALCNTNGTLITEYEYSDAIYFSEYAMAQKITGETVLLSSTGTEVVRNITGLKHLFNYVWTDGKWTMAEDFTYIAMLSGDGYKVMKVKLYL